MDACLWCSVYVFKFRAWWVWARRGGLVPLERSFTCFRGMLPSAFRLVVVCQKATGILSRSGGDRLTVMFPSVVQFQFPTVAEIRRRHLGRRDFVATGWPSPSSPEGDVPMVAFRLPSFYYAWWCSKFSGRALCRFCGGHPSSSTFARCLALEGLSRSEVVSVSWDPHPHEPVEGGSRLRVCLSWQPTLVPEPRREVRHGAAAWPGCGVACIVCFYGGSVSPFAGVEARARLASRACGLWVPLLAASGGGLVAVVVLVFPHESVVAPACMAFRPGGVSTVRGGSACGPSSLWRSEVVVLESSELRAMFCKTPGATAGVREVGSLQLVSERGSTEICVRLPCMVHVCAAVGCGCCCAACMGIVIAQCLCRGGEVGGGLLGSGPSIWRTLVGKSSASLCAVLCLVGIVARAKQMLCVLLEFFSIGSGGSENRCCCPGEGFSQDYFALLSAVAAVLPQGLRYAASVGLAVPLAVVFSLMVRVVGLCILVKVLPRIAL
ncbi:hypothetical protein Taro_041676 [Colocasia esculenta]|uniref:Uncharacterized protein n=1 Tax=Colocasia esculenta TaxID=4460 RepID=A0A843WGH5_COLES|nr:hypothetical protein [Colocasia esculenta]